MIELSRHIEALLLRHDCVIVPGLGGFVTQYVPAHCDDEGGLFLPPKRIVGFNPDLTLNDGLLVQSFMKTYDASYPEAQRMIENAVADLKARTQKDGDAELKGIGTLTLNLYGDYSFTPNASGLLSPDLYALVPVVASPAEKTGKLPRKKQHNGADDVEEKRTYTFSINRELCNYVAAAVVALLLYFAWATPVGIGTNDEGAQASISVSPLKIDKAVDALTSPKDAPKDATKATKGEEKVQTVAAKEEVKVEKNKQSSAKAQEAAKSDASEKAETPAAEEHASAYVIVLSSGVTQKNAELYVKELQKEGISDARVSSTRKMRRVVCGSYASEDAAYNALRLLRKNHAEAAEAWVMFQK